MLKHQGENSVLFQWVVFIFLKFKVLIWVNFHFHGLNLNPKILFGCIRIAQDKKLIESHFLLTEIT